jgi:hypothetical protein
MTHNISEDLTPEIIANRVFTNDTNKIMLSMDDITNIDLFQILLEISLYGVIILSNNKFSIFGITDSNNIMLNILNKYLSKLNYKIILQEIDTDIDTYYMNCDYFVEISNNIYMNEWCVGNYSLSINPLFSDGNKISNDRADKYTSYPLQFYRACFKANNKIFYLHFIHHYD